MEDLEKIKHAGLGRVDVTVGSALGILGGNLAYKDVVAWHKQQEKPIPYFIAETTMPGRGGFDFYGSSQSFNVLAEYLFGKNEVQEKMDMTTPVITRRIISDGEKMEMTTPVITKKSDQETWQMSFVMPSKYGANLPLPKDRSVRIKKVPKNIIAVVAFSGFATDEEVAVQESKLRDDLKADVEFQIKDRAMVEVSLYNPPFTLPFTRRNEIALEVEWGKAIS
ncbi:Heme-binding-like protein [Drosera capensis]